MQKDFQEPTEDNPILHLLEKHDAFSLIDEKTSCLYPQIWGLCDFERKGIGYIGEYESPDKPINITYKISQSPQYEDILTCQAKAPLKYWTHWEDQFPEDFIQALVKSSPSGKIFPYKEITLVQQLTFQDPEIKVYKAIWANIYKGWEMKPVYKINNRPVIIGSPI